MKLFFLHHLHARLWWFADLLSDCGNDLGCHSCWENKHLIKVNYPRTVHTQRSPHAPEALTTPCLKDCAFSVRICVWMVECSQFFVVVNGSLTEDWKSVIAGIHLLDGNRYNCLLMCTIQADAFSAPQQLALTTARTLTEATSMPFECLQSSSVKVLPPSSSWNPLHLSTIFPHCSALCVPGDA